jgi:2-haloacid dehalogenase
VARARNGSIEAVTFDLGGVLLDWNPRYLYRKLFDDEEAMERFLSEVCTMEWHEANDRGVPFEVTCAQLATVHPEHAEHIWAWGTRTEEMVGGPIHGTVEILRELARDGSVRLFALTNMEAHTYPLRRERYEFLRWFEGTVVSSSEGVTKPDSRIYQVLLERYGLKPDSTLMIDDNPRNVEAARALGMPAVLFESPEALRAELEDAGVLGTAEAGRELD